MPTFVYVPGVPYIGPAIDLVRGMGGGASPPPDPTPPSSQAMQFNAAANSQYLILLEDI